MCVVTTTLPLASRARSGLIAPMAGVVVATEDAQLNSQRGRNTNANYKTLLTARPHTTVDQSHGLSVLTERCGLKILHEIGTERQ